MSLSYILSLLSPATLIFLITAVIVFMLVFIQSMATSIDRTIEVLGSGTLSLDENIDLALLPKGSSIDSVVKAEGILYSENQRSIVYLKGVNESYFSTFREELLKLETREKSKNPIYISSTLARHLKVELGDRMTLLLYEKDKKRTRPFLMTVDGVFDTGYAQLDRYMAFVDNNLLGNNPIIYEVLLPLGENVERVQEGLESIGYRSFSYKEIYPDLYLNVKQSIAILYLIFIFVVVLAAFFASDIAQVYISRDSKDIASLLLLGVEEREIRLIYTLMTLLVLSFSSFLGVVLGLLLGTFSPKIIKLVMKISPELLENYISSFSLDIPYLKILVMLISLILVSYITLLICLKKLGKSSLKPILYNE